jgi:predicted nucleotide-binding protein
MDELATTFARLAGIRRGLQSLLDSTWGRGATKNKHQDFSVTDAADYFHGSEKSFQVLRDRLPGLYDDLPKIGDDPEAVMIGPDAAGSKRYGRNQLDRLARAIDQIFETRAHSELATPVSALEPRVFISHGRSEDWRKVQAFIERDLNMRTLELAQEPNRGRTILAKLDEETRKCTYAVIVMTGDDTNAAGVPVARQNVLHEIGFLQARLGLSAVCLLHEEGTDIFSNIHGLVYSPFPKGNVEAAFGLLLRELQAALNSSP